MARVIDAHGAPEALKRRKLSDSHAACTARVTGSLEEVRWLERAGFAQHHPELLGHLIRGAGATAFGLSALQFAKLQLCRRPQDEDDAELLARAFGLSAEGSALLRTLTLAPGVAD